MENKNKLTSIIDDCKASFKYENDWNNVFQEYLKNTDQPNYMNILELYLNYLSSRRSKNVSYKLNYDKFNKKIIYKKSIIFTKNELIRNENVKTSSNIVNKLSSTNNFKLIENFTKTKYTKTFKIDDNLFENIQLEMNTFAKKFKVLAFLPFYIENFPIFFDYKFNTKEKFIKNMDIIFNDVKVFFYTSYNSLRKFRGITYSKRSIVNISKKSIKDQDYKLFYHLFIQWKNLAIKRDKNLIFVEIKYI